MQTGDIVFVRTKGIIPFLIRLFDPGRFNHVTVMLNETHCLNVNYNTTAKIIPFDFSQDYEVVQLKNLTPIEKSKIVHLAIQMVGTRYDFSLIIDYMVKDLSNFDLKLNNPKDLVCNEMIEAILYGIGRISKDEYLNLYQPNELYQYLLKLNNT